MHGAGTGRLEPEPGWWLASDGWWYPPESRPPPTGGPAPTPEPHKTSRLPLVILLIAALLGALVGYGAYSAVRGSSSASGAVTLTSTAAGCGRPHAAGSYVLYFTDQGRSRSAVVHVPTRYAPTRPTPVVFLFHGSGSDGPGMEQYTGMDATSDSDHFIAVYPTASIPASGGGYDWNVSGDPVPGTKTAPDDVRFTVDLLGVLEQRYCINPRMVYATGFSRGARLSDDLACRASAVFAAVAPSSGVRLPVPCPSSRPVSILAIHGTADTTDPYDGNGPTFWTYSVPVAVHRWAVHDGCSVQAVTTDVATWTTRTAYQGCPSGVAVELYTVQGADHAWQGGLNGYYQARDSAIDGDSVIWSFFASHPMP